MLRNYFKIAIRNLLKNKIFSIINITGLAIGMAVSMVILLYVSHELSYDSFHTNAQRIFGSYVKINFGGNEVNFDLMSKNFGPAIQKAAPGVKDIARIASMYGQDVVMKSDAEHTFFEQKVVFSEPSLFRVFSIDLLQGHAPSALKDPNTVIITEEMAEKYFGRTNPIGKVLTYNKKDLLKVTGVFKKLPTNSSFHFDFIASMATFDALMKRDKKDSYESEEMIGTGSYETYFLLDKPESAAVVQRVIPKLLTKQPGSIFEGNARYFLTPLLEKHLGSNWSDFSNNSYIAIFLSIAGIVLLLALINYMSLTTARSTIRAKEVGVRKVLGANRSTLATQFYGESIIISLISFGLALLLFNLLRQPFYQLLGLQIDDSFITSPLFLSVLLAVLVASALIAGSYPALLLSKFSPVLILKGNFSGIVKGANLRKAFLVFQFMASVVMIICSLVVQKQLHYVQTKKIGLNKEQVLVIPLSSEAQKHYTAFRADLQQTAGVQKVGAASLAMYKGGWNMYFTKTPTTKEDVTINFMTVDENFMKILQLEWKKKPLLNQDLAGGRKVLLNETGIEKLKITTNPIGQRLDMGDQSAEVVGVLKDFNFTSLQSKIDGMLFTVVKDTTALRTLYLRLNPAANLQQKLAQIETIYQKYDPEVPFDYYFLDDAFNSLYRSEQRMGTLFAGFTGLAILIACMGLFGLITFTAEQKTKEIGIRKVLGASVVNVVGLLSKDFLRLVLIANGLAFPIAYYFMSQWLKDFAYRTDIGVETFVVSGAAAVAIALATVTYQAVRAALTNPVKSLKSE